MNGLVQIPKSTFIMEYAGEVIDHDEYKKRLDDYANLGQFSAGDYFEL